MTQPAPTQIPALAPVAPVASVPGGMIVTPGMLTARDVAALRRSSEILSEQLQSTAARRRSVREAMRSATGSDRAGLEQRLGVLDARILRLESEIDATGRQIASVPAAMLANSAEPFGLPAKIMDELVPIAVVFTLFVLSPIAVSIARLFWKRGSIPRHAAPSPENAQRLERMEQAIDSIAIEMERVSEGQRFVTRLLSDARPSGALQQGGAERVGAPAAVLAAGQR